jgi:SAM-dependent methyltransferase
VEILDVPVADKIESSDAADAGQAYRGHRILEAMHSAQRYAEAVFEEIRAACPATARDLLDFGAGDGVFVAKFMAGNRRVDCVEPDPTLRQRLQQQGASVYSDIAAVPAGRYDFIYSVNVLEHIHALDETLAGIRRVMRAGAPMFVFVPAFNTLWTSLDDEVEHVQRFTRRSLRPALAKAGFEILDLRYFDSLGFPAALAVRALETVGLFRYSSDSVGFYDRYLFPMSRALDRVASRAVGKNIIAIVRNPDGARIA